MGSELIWIHLLSWGLSLLAVEPQLALVERNQLRKMVFLLAWPAIVEMLLQMTVGIVDTAMVGRLGASSLAAVGLAQQIFMLSTTIFAAIVTGSTALVARSIGAQELQEAGDVARQSLLVGLCVAGAVLLTLLACSRGIVGFLFRTAEPDVLAASSAYIRIVAFALIFNFILMTVNAVLRGAGDTKTPMRITGIVNVINVIANYVFIFGLGPIPALGVSGAALGTAIAQSVGGLLALKALLSNTVFPVNLGGPYRFEGVVIKRILNIGIPAALEQSTMRIGQLFYTMIVSSLGTIAYAAHQVALNAESLSFMPGFGFSLAATTLVGQSLGAKKPDQAEQSGYIANQMAMLVMSIVGIIFFVFPKQLVSIFSTDTEVIALASVCLRIVAVSQPALATIMVLAGGLRGAGDTRAIMKITTAGFFVVRVGLAYILAIQLGYGLVGAWMAMVVDLVFRGILMRLRFGSGRWKTLKI